MTLHDLITLMILPIGTSGTNEMLYFYHLSYMILGSLIETITSTTMNTKFFLGETIKEKTSQLP